MKTTLEEITAGFRRRNDATVRRIVLCGGTGCVANGALKVRDALVKKLNHSGINAHIELRDEDSSGSTYVSKSGCQGFCQMGPLVTIAHRHGISIEAELGHVGGLEGDMQESGHDSDCLTDPNEAVEFVRETGIDCLAVGIGTVHGDYKGEPKINLDRLKEIFAVIDIPLVLHGGSGTPEKILTNAISLGISKINICTEIHKTWLEGVALAKKELTPSVPGKFYRPAHDMLRQKVIDIIKLFSNGRAAARPAGVLK